MRRFRLVAVALNAAWVVGSAEAGLVDAGYFTEAVGIVSAFEAAR